MVLTLNSLVAMAWRTVKNPREGAAEVLALGIPREALWTILLLTVVLSIILAQITTLIVGVGDPTGMIMGPVATGVIQLALLILIVFAVFWVGRAMGGTGSLEESMLLVAWLQFIMICVQVIQTASLLVLPPLAGILGVLGIALFLWLLTNFVAVLHGFRSLAQVFVMILVSAFTIAFVLSIVMTLVGISIPMGVQS